jgi:hypothetical protein
LQRDAVLTRHDGPQDLLAQRHVDHLIRIDDVQREALPRPAHLPCHLDRENVDRQHIARLGAFDEEGPGHRVWLVGPLHFLRVEAMSVERRGGDRIAICDMQHCRMRAQRLVENRW